MRYPARGRRCASPARPAAAWPARSARPARAALTRNLSTAEIVEQVRRGRGGHARRRSARRAAGGCPTWSSWAWASRWPTTPACSPPCAGSSIRRRPVSACRSVRSPCPPSAWSRPSTSWPTRTCNVTLAVSLHAPDDELRDTLVPVNTRWQVAEVLAAADALRRPDRAALLHRVRHDPRRQRPAVAGRPAGQAAAPAPGPARARQPDPAQPDARAAVGRLAQAGRAGVRAPAARAAWP